MAGEEVFASLETDGQDVVVSFRVTLDGLNRRLSDRVPVGCC